MAAEVVVLVVWWRWWWWWWWWCWWCCGVGGDDDDDDYDDDDDDDDNDDDGNRDDGRVLLWLLHTLTGRHEQSSPAHKTVIHTTKNDRAKNRTPLSESKTQDPAHALAAVKVWLNVGAVALMREQKMSCTWMVSASVSNDKINKKKKNKEYWNGHVG
jgi:hypothetical protein